MTPLLRNILIALVLGGILYVGYLVLFPRDELASEDTLTLTTAAEARAFLLRLQTLRAVDFNTELFDEPRFQSLIDYRVMLPQETAGRENPFAPVAP